MAEVNTGDSGGGRHHKKKRAKRSSTRIDMTPMVDLGFLLLTFFMLATTFSQPKIIELTPPAKTDTTHFTKIIDSLALTIVISGNNRIYYYNGKLSENPDSNNIQLSNLSDNGIRKVILQRNHYVLQQLVPIEEAHKNRKIADTTYNNLKQKVQGSKHALYVIIKTDSVAKYKNVVALLDEMNICNVDKYALVPASKGEVLMMEDYNNKHNIK